MTVAAQWDSVLEHLRKAPLSKHEGGLGFCFIVHRRRAADDDGGSTVSSQRVLQDSGHLTVSVWDVGFL